MRRESKLSPIAIGVVCLAVGYGATVVAQGQPGGDRRRSLKVGVVDIGLLFKEYERKDVLEEQVNAERERMQAEMAADEEELRKMRVALDNSPYKRGSSAWLLEADRIQQAQYALELKRKRLQASLKNDVEEMTLMLLNELEATISKYGRRHGYTVILKVDRGQHEDQGELAQQFQERIFRAQISDVLYHRGEIDCSQNVLTLLNSADNLAEMERLAEERGKK